MGRVFFNTRLNISKITADYTPVESDSGKLFFVNPTAATTITMPTLGTVAQEGWNCKIVLNEDATGADEGMNAKINIDLGSGTNVANVGWISDVDSGAGDHCVADDDFINITTEASPGDTLFFWTDGNRWYIEGHVKDASEVAFAQSAA